MSYEAWRISFQSSEQAARSAYEQLSAEKAARKGAEAERDELRKWKKKAEKQEAVYWLEADKSAEGCSAKEVANSFLFSTNLHTKKPVTGNPVWELVEKQIPSPDVAALQKRIDGLLELNTQLSKDHAAYAFKCNDLSVRNDELQKRVVELEDERDDAINKALDWKTERDILKAAVTDPVPEQSAIASLGNYLAAKYDEDEFGTIEGMLNAALLEKQNLERRMQNEQNRLGCIIENHIDDMTWLLRECGLLTDNEIPGKLWGSGCRIARGIVREELNTLLAQAEEKGRKEAVPDGWQVVPKVVVGKMGTYLCNCDSENGMTPETCTAQDALNGLLAAAPTPAKEE